MIWTRILTFAIALFATTVHATPPSAPTSTQDRITSGSYVGDGSGSRIINGGYLHRSDVVIVKGENIQSSMIRLAGFDPGFSKELGDNADLFNGGIIDSGIGGFTVDGLNHVNEPGVVFHWIAIEIDNVSSSVGSYWGNDVVGRSLSGLGYQPDYLLVVPYNSGFNSTHRHAGMPGSIDLNDGDIQGNRILSFDPDGFTLGDNDEVNRIGVQYHFLGFKGEPGIFDFGSYAGSSTDNRTMASGAFDPKAMWVKRDNPSKSRIRFGSQLGDATIEFGTGSFKNNRIQRLVDGGFEIGSHDDVNELGRTFYWAAWGARPATDLVVLKTVDDLAPAQGDTVSFTVRIENLGALAATNVIVTDALSAGAFTFIDAVASRGSYAADDWTVGTVVSGSADSLVIRAQIVGAPGTFGTNTATLTSLDQTDSDVGNNESEVTVSVSNDVDLNLTMIGDTEAVEGDGVEYQLTVTNDSVLSATGVIVGDKLPDGLNFDLSITSRGSYIDSSGDWDIGTIAPGDSVWLTLRADVMPGTAGSTIINSASIQALNETDVDPANDSAEVHTVVLATTDVSVQVTASESSYPVLGDAVFTVSAINHGPFPATNLLVEDRVPPETLLQSAVVSQGTYTGGDGLWDVGTLAVGDTATVVLTAQVNDGTQGETVINLARRLAMDQVDLDWSNDAATVSFTVEEGASDLSTQLDLDTLEPIVPGAFVDYTLSVENHGPDDATSVELLLPAAPPGTSYIESVPSQGTYNLLDGVWLAGDLTTGSVSTMTVRIQADPGSGGSTIAIGATVRSLDQTDAVPANDSSQISFDIEETTDFAVNLSMSDSTPAVGDTVYFGLRLTNLGPAAGSGILVRDELNPPLEYVSHWSTRGSFDPTTGEWTVAQNNPGDVDSVRIAVRVMADGAGAFDVHEAYLVESTPSDNAPGNNHPGIPFTVRSTVDLAIDVGSDRTNAAVGDTIVYAIQLTNPNNITATGISVDVPTPEGFTLFNYSSSEGTYDGTNTWTISSLASGETVILGLQGTADVTSEGSVLDLTATISATDQERIGLDDDSATVSVSIGFVPDVAVSLGADRSSALVGDVVRFMLRAVNAGGTDLAGIMISNPIPVGTRYIDHLSSNGVFDPSTGSWLLGELGIGKRDSVGIRLEITEGTKGTSIQNVATLSSVVGGDGVPSNDADSVSVAVGETIDLALEMNVNVSEAGPFESVGIDVVIANLGSISANTIGVVGVLPASMVIEDSAVSGGAFDASSFSWSLPILAPGARDTLFLTVYADETDAGSPVVIGTSIDSVFETDRDASNDFASVSYDVLEAADLDVSLSASDNSPSAGDQVTFEANVTNLAGATATNVVISIDATDGLSFVSSSGDGSFSSSTGTWSIPSIAMGQTAELVMNTLVLGGFGDQDIFVTDSLTAIDQHDPDPSNNADSQRLTVNASVLVTGSSYPSSTALPGAARGNAFRFTVENQSSEVQTLTSLSLQNAATGPGNRGALDASWGPLVLSTAGSAGPVDEVRLGASTFSSGTVTFSPLSLAIEPGDDLIVTVSSSVSTMARDGDVLDVELDETGLTFASGISAAGDFPFTRGAGIVVDGMSAAQVTVHADALPRTLSSDSSNILALDMVMPSNGYASDELHEISIVNRLGVTAGGITGMVAWHDDGSGTFDPQSDTELGDFAFTGDRWQLSGLSLPVQVPGERMFVTIDLGADADGQVRLALVETEMASANDGRPLDRPVESGVTQSINTSNRVRFAAEPLEDAVVQPGTSDAVLLHATAHNFYTDARRLTALRVSNLTAPAGAATTAERDAIVSQLRLVIDTNRDETFDDGDLTLAGGGFTDGACQFTGLVDAVIPAGERVHLFIVGEVSLTGAADSDEIQVEIGDGLDLAFAEATATSALWPLSGPGLTVDGMIAAQVDVGPISPITLGAGEGPALALDFHLPGNGYATDLLNGITFENFGSATAEDLTELRLFRDGGNDAFDAGGGDDLDLGALSFVSGFWRTSFLSESIDASGARLYVGVTVSTVPTDSTTVRLGIPLNGITHSSGNDGPIDTSVSTETNLLLSSAPLSQTFTVDPDRSTEGQIVTLRMTVRNGGDEAISGITPSPIQMSGDATMTLIAGPIPATMDLVGGGSFDSFTWTYSSDAAGTVRWAGDAGGLGDDSGVERRSLATSSNPHTAFVPASDVELFPTANMPPAVTRGGLAGIIPLTLTFKNPGGEDASEIELRILRLRVESSDGSDIVPADLIERVTLTEGADQFADRTDLETSGSIFEIPLDTPLVLKHNESATLGLRLFIVGTTTVENFQIVMPDPSFVEAVDAISETQVSLVLPSTTFPVQSGVGTLVGGSDGLLVTGEASFTQTSSAGQGRIELLRVQLENQSSDGQVSTVEIGEVAVRLVAESGAPIEDPASILQSVTVESAGVTHASQPLTSLLPQSVITVPFDLAVDVPPDQLIELVFYGDLRVDTSPQSLRVELFESTRVIARDATSGEDVIVSFLGGEIASRLHQMQFAATEVRVESTPLFPPNLVIGAQATAGMSVAFRHPGGTQTADVRVDSLWVHCVNDAGQLIDGGDILDGLRLFWNDALVSDAGDPGSGSVYGLSVGGLDVAAGTQGTLRIEIDVEPTAPAGSIELLVEGSGLIAVDANSDIAISVAGEDGFVLPLRSGAARLTRPADELVVGFSDITSAVIARGTVQVPVAELAFGNESEPGGTPIEVESLVIRANDSAGSAIDAGSVLEAATLYHEGAELGTVSGLVDADAVVTFVFDPPLSILPSSDETIELRVIPASTSPVGGFQLGLEADDIVVTQPGGAILEIRVEAKAGDSFPYYTRPMTLTAQSLEQSYANFPNPFAAGRSSTRFVYFLEGAGEVTLTIFTVRGKRVATLLNGQPLPAGLHQNVDWDGRNGNGSTVRNGVYVAEIDVVYDDGRRARERRKVAVVR